MKTLQGMKAWPLAMLALLGAMPCFASSCEEGCSTCTSAGAACQSGEYDTVMGFLGVPKVKSECFQTLKLNAGCCGEVSVSASIHDFSAPLVVVLLGIAGRTQDNFSKLWPQWLSDAGYHVLTFDSTFRPEFVQKCAHGPSGNLWAESNKVRDIVSAFLNEPQAQGRVSQIGIVGMSYGGLEALVLGEMANEGRLPFKVSLIRAYSPPVDLRKTAEILDDWYVNDRFQYTLSELQWKFGGYGFGGYKSSKDPCCEKMSMELLRAAISASFHEELKPVVIRNDAVFHTEALPSGDEFTKDEYAEVWGFEKYADDLALPAWRERIGAQNVDDMIRATDLCELLSHQPSYSKAIVAENDPFNTAEDVARLKSCAGQDHLTLLSHGGHLGYIADDDTKATLMSLFGPSERSMPASYTQPSQEAR
ncbi:MAG TPA: hypothetical protein VGP72_05095 [Planctomycetota bacterium]